MRITVELLRRKMDEITKSESEPCRRSHASLLNLCDGKMPMAREGIKVGLDELRKREVSPSAYLQVGMMIGYVTALTAMEEAKEAKG